MLSKEEKRRLKCTDCMVSEHEDDDCFKLHEVLNWYKRFKENRQSAKANQIDNDEDEVSSYGGIEQRETPIDMNNNTN